MYGIPNLPIFTKKCQEANVALCPTFLCKKLSSLESHIFKNFSMVTASVQHIVHLLYWLPEAYHLKTLTQTVSL